MPNMGFCPALKHCHGCSDAPAKQNEILLADHGFCRFGPAANAHAQRITPSPFQLQNGLPRHADDGLINGVESSFKLNTSDFSLS